MGLEAEAMLLGIWKNFEELEKSISLDELEAILSAEHDREHRDRKFMAALKGIDIDEQSKDSIQERFDAIKNRAEAVNSGRNVEEVELDFFHLDMEVEE